MSISSEREAVHRALAQATGHAVAFIDETYSVEKDRGVRFYALAAVVVQLREVEVMRRGLVLRVPNGYWHTSEALLSPGGRCDTLDLVEYLADPGGSEMCVIAVTVPVADDDATGEDARASCLSRLMVDLSRPECPEGQVRLFVLERRRTGSQCNAGASTRAKAVNGGLVHPGVRLLQVGPAAEPLLWLADVACSAWRQEAVRANTDLFDPMRGITRII